LIDLADDDALFQLRHAAATLRQPLLAYFRAFCLAAPRRATPPHTMPLSPARLTAAPLLLSRAAMMRFRAAASFSPL
jgi:hypothetical protein